MCRDRDALGPPANLSEALKRIEIRVTPEQRTAVERAAEPQGVSISSGIRELIDERVEDRRDFPGRRIIAAPEWDRGDDDRYPDPPVFGPQTREPTVPRRHRQSARQAPAARQTLACRMAASSLNFRWGLGEHARQ